MAMNMATGRRSSTRPKHFGSPYTTPPPTRTSTGDALCPRRAEPHRPATRRPMPLLQVSHIHKSFAGIPVAHDVSIHVGDGGIAYLLGLPGEGKLKRDIALKWRVC